VASGQWFVISEQWPELDKYTSFESGQDEEMISQFRNGKENYLNT
jgi:hypothetical protein